MGIGGRLSDCDPPNQSVMRAIHQAAELLVHTQQHADSHLMLTSPPLGPVPHQIVSCTFVQHLQTKLDLTACPVPCCPADLSSFPAIMHHPMQQQTMSAMLHTPINVAGAGAELLPGCTI